MARGGCGAAAWGLALVSAACMGPPSRASARVGLVATVLRSSDSEGAAGPSAGRLPLFGNRAVSGRPLVVRTGLAAGVLFGSGDGWRRTGGRRFAGIMQFPALRGG